MNKLFEISRWGMMLMAITGLIFIYSCGGDEEPEPEPEPIDPPSALTYTATTVAVGAEGTLTPTISGDAATFEITDMGTAQDVIALTIDASTGVISVPGESTLGVYTVEVTATNESGNTKGTAEITIGVNDDFNPVGKKLEWKIMMNRSENLELTGLDGVPGLPIQSLVLPSDWPTASTPAEDLLQYGIMTGVQGLLLQVPGDEACGALDPKENGDTLLVIVNEDLTLSTVCTADAGDGSTVEIGSWTISYVDSKFVFALELVFMPGLALPYNIDDARFAEFTDVYTDPTNPAVYQALQGTVLGMTTPTDLTTEETIQDFTKWAIPNVDVVLRVIE